MQPGQTFSPDGNNQSNEPPNTDSAPAQNQADVAPSQPQASASAPSETIPTTTPQVQPAPQPVMTTPVPPSGPVQPPANSAAPVGFGAADAQRLAKKNKRKSVFIGLAAALFVVLAGVGYFAMIYLPNTPENIYRRGMASIGVGLEELASDDSFGPANATSFKGEFNVTSPTEVRASFSGTTTVSGDGEFDVDVEWGAYNPTLQTYYTIMGDKYPQLFFKFDGVKPVADTYLGPGAFDQIFQGKKVEGVWWLLDTKELVDLGYISQKDLDTLLADAQESQNGLISADDYNALTQAFIESTGEYLFTADTSKMVLERVEDLGVEAYEGVDSQKYRVEVNKDNLKLHIKDLRDRILATGVLQKLDSETDFAEELNDQEIDEFVDEMDLSKIQIEAWVGLNNKVLRNIRLTNLDAPEGSTQFVDISLLLEDDNLDIIPIRFRNVDESEFETASIDINMTADIAARTTEFAMDVVIDYENGDDVKMDGSLLLTSKSEEPALEKPTGAKSFVELIKLILGDVQSVLGARTDLF